MDAVLPGQFEPAREQLYVASVVALDKAYYQVREAESQAFFGFYRAEIEAQSLERGQAHENVIADFEMRGRFAFY
jgi:hypothetical protein